MGSSIPSRSRKRLALAFRPLAMVFLQGRKGVLALKEPENVRGALVIRTRFGEIAAGPGSFIRPVEELMKDPDWCEAVGLEGRLFCYTDAERDMPF